MREHRRALGSAAAVAVAVAAVVGIVVLSATGPRSRGVANLWVSLGGGACVRRAAAGRELPDRDCGSLNAAYQRAHCGDVVNITTGDYAATQNLQDAPALDSCAAPVVFQSAPGASVTLNNVEAGNYGDVTTNGASWWTLQNVSLGNRLAVLPPAHNVTVNRVRGGSFYVNGVHDMTIENSTFGPCYSGHLVTGTCDNNNKIDSGYNSGGDVYATTNVNIAHNTIHDFVNNGNTHFECVFIVGGTNITFDANRFGHCQNYGIFMQPFSGQPFNNVVIENNWFYQTKDDAGSTIYAVDFGGNGATISNVLIRFNSFAPDEGVTSDGGPLVGSNDRVVGNIGGDSWYQPCIHGVTYAYNIWNRRGCSSTDRVVSRLPYLDASPGAEDFHLLPGSTAHGFVTAHHGDLAVPRDFYGSPRPIRGALDAGAVQS